MKSAIKRFKSGILDENPVFIQVLGMCPTLAVTTSAENGIGMGLATTTVLIMANLVISLLRNIIPSKVRIPAFIVVIASFVTIVDFMLQGFVPALYASLGIFIPLIVVNCVILGRAEGFASKNKPFISVIDGLGMGLGFTLALGAIGAVREILGAGTLFGMNIMPSGYVPISIMILAPGAFLVLGILLAAFNYVLAKAANRN
ncbi:putative inner membrane NADH-quinone reductase [Petrocella atlantisensis]|uniref:Ion-translocating oxidoreductase complex subunit E n=1 Tax=Petrocella atlantisensis TaxID=2173034 RepID=A0A3P7P6H8_9FIRM|nr:electron transport complex subunit E [Petrocella atlantisensis]MCF8020351.1 electron transport complex subunit E [Vallitaleaceae bacterium]PKM54494.1 MAG: electron transport complex subunit RsxE [Firmicutes bacterium HGW-Firmicutes-5]VDN45953.1 putative inner membrane NADH-quinone reductase [Petrocella atlantisensis]